MHAYRRPHFYRARRLWVGTVTAAPAGFPYVQVVVI